MLGFPAHCARELVRGRVLKLGCASASAFSCSNPFPYAGAFCRARRLKTLGDRLHERFVMTYRTSGEAVLWDDISRLRGRVFTGARYVFALSGKTLVAGADDLQMRSRSCSRFAIKKFLRRFFYRGFQPPRARRKKRADVEIFRPFLPKFRLAGTPQKSRNACSC